MKRRLLTAISLFSLVLCLATVVLWVRSYFSSERFLAQTRWYSAAVTPSLGRVEISVCYETSPFYIRHGIDGDADSMIVFWYHRGGGRPATAVGWRYQPVMGFGYGRIRSADYPPGGIVFPFWAATLTTSMLPVLRLTGWLRTRYRLARGRCAGCGYDLRASTDRCPECGAPVPRKTEAIA